MAILSLLVCGLLMMRTAVSYKTLNLVSYTQLPTSFNRGQPVYGGVNLGAAIDAAYDFANHIIYVIGDTSHLMHVIDINDPSNPQILVTHHFNKGEGVPQSVDVCGPEVAVVLAAQTDVNEGHVRFYHTYQRGSVAPDVTLDGFVTVGPHPKQVKYTRDCNTLLVTNEGTAGKDEGGAYFNPEGSVTIVHSERTGNPSVRQVDFSSFNIGGTNHNPSLRAPSLYIPGATHSPQTTVAEDIQPCSVVISKDQRYAWVTLQTNNAIAQINIYNGLVDKVTPLPRKDFSSLFLDASDRDGGVHRRTYDGLLALRQPGTMSIFEIGNKRYLFTGDEGKETTYTSANQGFAWTDKSTARSIYQQIDSTHVQLRNNASNDELLGRLGVSNVDGKNTFTGEFEHLEMFGGRGFSIWDSGNIASPIFDSDDTLEQYMEDFEKDVFNTDYVPNTASYQSPESTRDVSSPIKGPAVTGLDVVDDNGTVYLAVGTSSIGTLYLYTVDTASGQPIPQFQSIVRSGVTDLPWRDLYTAESIGDLYITDVSIIPSTQSPLDRPLVFVTSNGAGSLSIYEIVDATPIIPGRHGDQP